MTFQGEEDLKETPAPALPHKQRDHAARLHTHSSLHPGNSVLSSGSKISTTLFCLLQPAYLGLPGTSDTAACSGWQGTHLTS